MGTRTRESKRDNIVAVARIWVDTPNRLGTLCSIHAGSVCALISVSSACTAVAAESHRVGEDRVGFNGTARQNSSVVFNLIIGAAPLDKETWAKNIPHVAVLVITYKHRDQTKQMTIT